VGFKEPNHTPQLDTPEVGVWLKGPLPVLNKLDAKKLSLMLDLSKVVRRGVGVPATVVREVGPGDVKGLPSGVTANKVVPPRLTVRLLKRDQVVAPSP